MIDRWEIPEISVISTKVDRFAGILIAISEILPIPYGIRTETERSGVLVWVIPEISQMSWLCANSSVWRSVKNKINTYTSSTPGLYCKEQTAYIVYCLKQRVRNVNFWVALVAWEYANSSVWCTIY